MTATADLIRATVHNRIDNQVAGASVANHRRRRSDRSRAALPTVVCRGANSRSAQSHRRHFADNASLTGRAWGRRPVCGVRSGVGKSGLEALRAPSQWIRHRRSGQLVTETIPRVLRIIQGDGVSVSTIAGRPDFPRRRTGSRPSGRPVNRRYGHVENALDAGCWESEPHMTVSEASRTVVSSRADRSTSGSPSTLSLRTSARFTRRGRAVCHATPRVSALVHAEGT